MSNDQSNRAQSTAQSERRAVFADLMSPTEFAAWEALEAALRAWPGPGPAERDAWRKLAIGDEAAKVEARAELVQVGVDPTTGGRIGGSDGH